MPRNKMPTEESATDVVNELGGRSGRSSIIVAVALMDALLVTVLRAYLLPIKKQTDDDPLFGADRPLSSFSARINLAHRLGLIDENLANALHLLRKMRNEFAHVAVSGSFNQSPHKERVMQLWHLFPKSKKHWKLEEEVVSEKDYRSIARLMIFIVLDCLSNTQIETISDSRAVGLSPLGDDLIKL